MQVDLKKTDIIIVISLIVIAVLVLNNVGLVVFNTDLDNGSKTLEDTDDVEIIEEDPIPPSSYLTSSKIGVSGKDEGKHYNSLFVSREWWYYTVVITRGDLIGYTVSISFNHMARGDLLATNKPDMMIVTLHGPNGEEFGGIVNKERGLGLIKQPTLQAETPGVSITFEDSWVEGDYPYWHIHIEDNDIDKNHDITMDLNFFSPSDPVWTLGLNSFRKSESNLAGYVAVGCNVSGTIEIDNLEYEISGKGHHEHTWSPKAITTGMIKEWDFCHFVLDNGWVIYYNNYKSRHTLSDIQKVTYNPFGSIYISTDDGKTFTLLDDVDVTATKSDADEDKVVLHVKMPSEIEIEGEPSISQPLIRPSEVDLDISIEVDGSYNRVWKLPTYVGMKVGRTLLTGTLSWIDDDSKQVEEVSLNGIGTIWSMRALI